jgi:hypothetical protein
LIGFGFWVAVMLTALVAKGQTYEIKDVYPILTVESPIRVSDGYSSQDVYAAKYLTMLWDEWTDSCWADSTLHLINFSGGKDIYRHRDPNDLKGFMEFIKRRTK